MWLHSEDKFRGHSLSTGLIIVFHAVLTSTALTNLSLPGKVLTTRASGQHRRGVFSFATRTTSPTAIFCRSSFHLGRSCRVGRYSWTHRRQNWSAIYCTWRQRREYISPLENFPGGATGRPFKSNRSLGVRGFGSSGSQDTMVRGRLFTADSASLRQPHEWLWWKSPIVPAETQEELAHRILT